MTLNFMTAPLGLKLCILEPWEVAPSVGHAHLHHPLHPPRAALRGGSAERLAEARKGFSENWLYPDSRL